MDLLAEYERTGNNATAQCRKKHSWHAKFGDAMNPTVTPDRCPTCKCKLVRFWMWVAGPGAKVSPA